MRITRGIAPDSERQTPRWVFALIVAMGLLPLFNTALLLGFPPPGTVSSGLHTVDTYCYITPMREMPNGFASPYARVENGTMPSGTKYYGMPYHYLYGALGGLNSLVGLPPLWALAIANSLGIALLFWSVWCLLSAFFPQVRGGAFLLAVFGGGLGGATGFLAIMFGWWEYPQFQDAFPRWFRYDLVEGARGNLHLLQDRVYYTLPLALAFFGWVRLHHRHPASAGVPLVIATFINFRIGPMVWALGLLSLCATQPKPRIRDAAFWSAGMLTGLTLALAVVSRNPSHVESSHQIARESIAFTAFIASLGWLLPPALVAMTRALRAARGWTRAAIWSGAGYLAVFTLLFIAYHVYYGNWWLPLDFAAASKISDWALLGIPAGLVVSCFQPAATPDQSSSSPPAWLVLWACAFIGVGISAWGAGWFVQFTPQRFIVLSGLPVAVLAAYGICAWKTRTRAVYLALTILFGVSSIAFTWLVSHGPLHDRPATALLPWTRFAYISVGDEPAVDLLDAGVVLTPSSGAPLYGDVIAAQTACSVVYGNGTLDFSGEEMTAIRREVDHFFSGNATQKERLALLSAWQVRYVFCPARTPVPQDIRDAFQALPGMRVLHTEGDVLMLEREVSR